MSSRHYHRRKQHKSYTVHRTPVNLIPPKKLLLDEMECPHCGEWIKPREVRHPMKWGGCYQCNFYCPEDSCGKELPRDEYRIDQDKNQG